MTQFMSVNPHANMGAIFLLVLIFVVCLLAAEYYRGLFHETKLAYDVKIKTVNSLEDAVYQSTLDDRILRSASPAMLRMEGFEGEETDYLTFLNNKSRNNSKNWYVIESRQDEFFQHLKTHGKVENFVSQVYPMGSLEPIWISETAHVIHNPKTGKPDLYEGIIRDITDTVAHKSALKENKQAKERFKAFAETNTDWFWEMDNELRFCYFSETFESITGVNPDELLGKTRNETGIPMIEPEAYQAHLENLEAHRPFRDFIHPRMKDDGSVVWLAISANPVFDIDGSFEGYLGSGRDITDAKNRELELKKVQHENKETSILLDEAIDAMPQGLLIHDDDTILRTSSDLHEMLDIPVELVSRGSSLRKYVRYLLERGDQGDVDVEEALALSSDRCTQGKPFSLERTLPDGRVIVSYIRPRKNGGMVSVLTDVTEDRKREIELEKSQKLLTALADNLPSGLFQLVRNSDGTFHCPYISQRFREITELDKDVNVDFINDYLKTIHPDDVTGYLDSLNTSRIKCLPWLHEFRLHRKNGNYEWFLVSATPKKRINGSTLWHGYINNITKRKNDEQKIERLAYYDALTGLSNRGHFIQEMEVRLGNKNTTSGHSAICFVDIDNFKLLNDTHGHDSGDKLLQAVATRIKDNLRSHDLIGRFGGDEFVFLLDRLGCDIDKAKENANTKAQKILKEIQRGFTIGQIDCPTTISIGITMFDLSQGHKTSDLIKGADMAMYEAKKLGRNNVTFHNMQTHKSVIDSYNLQRDLQYAARENQFELKIQPQINRSGKIPSGEALIRWNHPQRGLIMPAEFIALAEQTGQIGLINNWVLLESVKLLSKWQNNPSLCNTVISVNISPRQMVDAKFCAHVTSLLNEYDVPPRNLMIELTEHVMARNPDLVAQNMVELKKYGVRFSLDDFGTGYSSLSQLKQFPFDELKIDGSFIADITEERDAQSLVSAIIGMACALEIKTVAEHVTSYEQFDFLIELGCDFFQGFMFSRPLSIKDFETFTCAHKTKLPEASKQHQKQA